MFSKFDNLTPAQQVLWQAAFGGVLPQIEASEWQSVPYLAVLHGTAPLVAEALKRDSGSSAPAEIADSLLRMRNANERRNTVIYRECGRLLRALSDAGIPALVLKGPALALTIYRSTASRSFNDFDILVRPEDRNRAIELAIESGFTPEGPDEPHRLDRSLLLDCGEDILSGTLPLEIDSRIPRDKVAAAARIVRVEIHHGLFRYADGSARETAMQPIWDCPVSLALPTGTPACTLSHEMMVVHLADHAAGHGFSRLQFFADMACLAAATRESFDWDRFVALCAAFQVEIAAYLCLRFLAEFCNVPISASVLAKLVPGRTRRVRIGRLSPATVLSGDYSAGRSHVLTRLRLSESPVQLVRGLFGAVFPPVSTMRRLYAVEHPVLIAACYAIRPVMIAGRLLFSGRHMAFMNRYRPGSLPSGVR
jgi:hypothetical protein